MIPFITLGMKPVACQDKFVGVDTNRQKVRQGIGPKSDSESFFPDVKPSSQSPEPPGDHTEKATIKSRHSPLA